MILEEVNCQKWQCFKYGPQPPNDDSNRISETVITLSCLILLVISILLMYKLRKKCESQSGTYQNPETPQDEPQTDPITTIANRNYYFSIDASSSSDDFDENLSVRTPIIKPKLHCSSVNN